MSKYDGMTIEGLMEEFKRKNMPLPSGSVAKELIGLLQERDNLVTNIGNVGNTTEKYPETKFNNIAVASFFYILGKLCIKYDEELYLEIDTVRQQCHLKEGYALKDFDVNVCDISYSYKKGKGKK